MAFASLFGETLLTKDGEKPTSEVLEGCSSVGVYFSAHWCPPCRGFTPALAANYTSHFEAKGMKIVFVSSDKDQESFSSYYGEMPWLALPFAAREKKQELSTKFGVSGVPCLVVLDTAGGVITKDGRGCVTKDPTGTNYPWSSGAAVLGNAAGGGGGTLQHGSTQNMVDNIKGQQKAQVRASTCQLFCSAVFTGLWFYGFSTATEACDTGPLPMKDVFLGLGIVNCVVVFLTGLSLYLAMSLTSEHAIKAGIYMQQGRQDEAVSEQQKFASDPAVQRNAKCLALVGCGMLCTGCFALVWGIMCFVSAINAGNDKNEPFCKDEKNLYWGIFVSNLVVSCCTQGGMQNAKKKQAPQ